MEQSFKIQIAEKCWKDSLNWTFRQIDILNKVYNGKGKLKNIEESIEYLRSEKEGIEKDKESIKSEIQKIKIHVKPIRNFKSSIEKLLSSNEIAPINIDSRLVTQNIDLYEQIENREFSETQLAGSIEKVKKNLEKNWVAFNQSFGRMLIKLKLNDYEIE
ncbi:MAG: hypothetical protein AB8F94_21495 [Saprospiraceae bacterium]